VVSLDIQLTASHADWSILRDVALKVENDEYDALWVVDHLAGVPFGGQRSLDCFTFLGALAEATTTIELGALVANVWNRQVGTLAVAAASVSEISGRRFLLGVGAGTSPNSRWAAEQHAVGAEIESEMSVRHRRVEDLLDLTDAMWRADRADQFTTFPLPSPVPPRIIGTNSIELSELAGRRAEGVNVAWNHPRRGELLDVARRAADGRPFQTTTWLPWSREIIADDHPVRVEIAAANIDRVILAVVDNSAEFLSS